MKQFFGYVRVSTAKQGEHGVSLQEQRDAIARYATQHGFGVSRWFEERMTAAHRGRAVFGEMLRLLRKGGAAGVIIHKIDRGARNLRDWAELVELFDGGVDVRFTNESLDLGSRGGRLSADIQAVVAADYIRNLREEIRKGFYGRLKEGLYPLPAPVGYSDAGRGKPKLPDPVRGPLVRRAFELYATGQFTLDTLVSELFRLGLRNRAGSPVGRNALSYLLNNPFYAGLIRLRRTGELFEGRHIPLISHSLFETVGARLSGRTRQRSVRHSFLFRRLLTCRTCSRSLVGELQKGCVYYRCHTSRCPTTSVREDTVHSVIEERLLRLRMGTSEQTDLRARTLALATRWEDARATTSSTVALREEAVAARLMRLTDAYLDGTIDKALFEERKASLLLERAALREHIVATAHPATPVSERLDRILELADTAWKLYETSSENEKRVLVEYMTSNRLAAARNVDAMLVAPFVFVAEAAEMSVGTPLRDRSRTLDALVERLVRWFAEHPVPLPWESLRVHAQNTQTEWNWKGAKGAG